MFDLRRFSYVSSSPLLLCEEEKVGGARVHVGGSTKQQAFSGGRQVGGMNQSRTRAGPGQEEEGDFRCGRSQFEFLVSGFFHSGQFVFSPSASLPGLCLSLVHNVQLLHLRLEEECVCVCVSKT